MQASRKDTQLNLKAILKVTNVGRIHWRCRRQTMLMFGAGEKEKTVQLDSCVSRGHQISLVSCRVASGES